MTIKTYAEIIQGSEEWFAIRCGILTASQVGLVLTPTLKPANNDKSRANLYELLAQRITKYVEPSYVSDDMLRGQDDEIYARDIYSKEYAPVDQVGFITNDQWGFTLGFSPDGLVGDDGFIEIKSRRQKFQIQTIIDGVMDQDFALQIQTGFVVTGRKWCDFISYCGGLPMITIRVYPDPKTMDAIVEAAGMFEATLATRLAEYNDRLATNPRLVPTERRIYTEMFV